MATNKTREGIRTHREFDTLSPPSRARSGNPFSRGLCKPIVGAPAGREPIAALKSKATWIDLGRPPKVWNGGEMRGVGSAMSAATSLVRTIAYATAALVLVSCKSNPSRSVAVVRTEPDAAVVAPRPTVQASAAPSAVVASLPSASAVPIPIPQGTFAERCVLPWQLARSMAPRRRSAFGRSQRIEWHFSYERSAKKERPSLPRRERRRNVWEDQTNAMRRRKRPRIPA